MDYIIYFIVILLIVLVARYIKKQITVSQNIRLEDTTLEELDEKLKKHKLIGGRHKRTNKKNPPIVYEFSSLADRAILAISGV